MMSEDRFSDLEMAYWPWLRKTCPHKVADAEARGAWMRSNRFPFDGQTWLRESTRVRSKTPREFGGWDVTHTGDDGTVIRSVAVPSSRWRKPDGQRRAA
jgi:hypothetical protein